MKCSKEDVSTGLLALDTTDSFSVGLVIVFAHTFKYALFHQLYATLLLVKYKRISFPFLCRPRATEILQRHKQKWLWYTYVLERYTVKHTKGNNINVLRVSMLTL